MHGASRLFERSYKDSRPEIAAAYLFLKVPGPPPPTNLIPPPALPQKTTPPTQNPEDPTAPPLTNRQKTPPTDPPKPPQQPPPRIGPGTASSKKNNGSESYGVERRHPARGKRNQYDFVEKKKKVAPQYHRKTVARNPAEKHYRLRRRRDSPPGQMVHNTKEMGRKERS